jgi:hypothetical protein
MACGANAYIETDIVKCHNDAVMLVSVDGHEDYVCHHHLTLLCKEKWPVT